MGRKEGSKLVSPHGSREYVVLRGPQGDESGRKVTVFAFFSPRGPPRAPVTPFLGRAISLSVLFLILRFGEVFNTAPSPSYPSIQELSITITGSICQALFQISLLFSVLTWVLWEEQVLEGRRTYKERTIRLKGETERVKEVGQLRVLWGSPVRNFSSYAYRGKDWLPWILFT